MIRLLGLGALLAAVAIAPAAVAQVPMSPVYRTEMERPPKADEAGRTSMETAPVKAEHPPDEHASPAKPEAVAQKPVATAPIPPSSSREDVGRDNSKASETGSRPTSAAVDAKDTATATPPSRRDPTSREGTNGAPPSPSEKAAGTEKPATAPDIPGSSSTEARTDQAEAKEPENPRKTVTRKGWRHVRTSRHARRPGPPYSYPPPALYAPAPYSGASRGYGGGAYGPSPYSSDGP